MNTSINNIYYNNKYYSNKLLSGAIAGCIEVSLTHPIDVIKIKIQNNNFTPLNNNYHSLYNGLYRGFYSRLIGIIPMRCIFWSVQTFSYDIYIKKYNNHKSAIFAGLTGGLVQSFIDNPIEVIKNYRVNKNNKCFIEILQKECLRGFYPTLYRNMIFASIVSYGINIKKSNDNYINFINGGIFGFCGAIITQPLDFIKTIQQNPNNNYNMMTIIKNNNIKTLMSGWFPRSILSLCSMSIGSFSYNYLIKKIDF